jgi:hypothetical protein
LLASDTKAPESQRGMPSNSTATNQNQMFHQFVQLLDSKLDQKLETFKRSLAEKDEYQTSQLKKLRTERRACNNLKEI